MDLLLEILLFPLGSGLVELFAGVGSALNRDESRVRIKVTGSCAYCRRKGSGLVACSTCRAPHHRDCATVNGRCAVYGCRNRSFRVPAA